MQIQGAIQDSLDEAYVLNFDDSEEPILDQILTQFEQEREAETEEKNEVVKSVSVSEAIAAIDQLHQWEVSQDQSSCTKVQGLRQWQREILTEQETSKRQTTLKQYFTPQ